MGWLVDERRAKQHRRAAGKKITNDQDSPTDAELSQLAGELENLYLPNEPRKWLVRLLSEVIRTRAEKVASNQKENP